MRKSEEAAVVRLVRHMKTLQAKIAKPERSEATEEEVKRVIELLWEWTPQPLYDMPRKTVIGHLVALLRGCGDNEYCYISSDQLGAIIRKLASQPGDSLTVVLGAGCGDMTDHQLYTFGKWNYKPTPLVDLLFDMQANPHMFNRDGNRK